MSLSRHIEDAAVRVKEASFRIEEARAKPLSLASVHEWLDALTDFVSALSDVHAYDNESVYERLNEIGTRLGVERLPGVSHGRK